MRGGIIGLVAGIVLLAAIAAGPALLDAGAAQRRAQEQAEIARRTIHNFDPQLALAAGRVSSDALREKDGSAAGGFEQTAGANRERLSLAEQAARQAGQESGDTIGVPDVMGIVQLAKAGEALDQARLLRSRLRAAESSAVAMSQDVARRQSLLARYKGVDSTTAVAALASDRGELEKMLAEAKAELAAAQQEIEQRESQRTQLGQQMQQLRTSLLSIEGTGFRLGDDSSFRGYADQYSRTAAQLADLQRQEQLLAHGGLADAKLDPENPLSGAIEGGTAQVGLDELAYRRSAAEERIARLETGLAALGAAAANADAYSQAAAVRAAELTAQVDAATKALTDQLKTVDDLHEAARGKEEEAIAAGGEAVSAFQRAKAAAEKYQRQAATLQREFDTQRLNPRLRAIADDKMLVQQAEADAADANTLVGRVYAERVERLSRRLDALQRLKSSAASVPADLPALETAVNEARAKALESLAAAADTYRRLAEGAGATAWVYHGGLATVNLIAAVATREGASAKFLADARESLTTALQGIEKSPYAAHLVRMRSHLNRQPASAPSAPADAGG